MQERVPCCHLERGCTGEMVIVFRGPKGMMPAHLENVRCACDRPTAGANPVVAQLIEMGFSVSQAEAAANQHRTLDAAVEGLLAGGEATPSKGSACAAAAPSNGSASSGSSAHAAEPQQVGECSICCEELFTSQAAMRCCGTGGRNHYFHAGCLNSWVQQCKQQGLQPTCPECRGPVQVRPIAIRRLLEGGKLDEQEMQAWRTLAQASEDADSCGWANLRPNVWKVALGTAVAVGVGLAIVAGVKMLSEGRREDKNRR